MKKLSLFCLLILSVLFSSTSCKKGEEDPFLNLKTRKARLSGTWELKNLEGFYKVGIGTENGLQTFSYSNGKMITISDNIVSSKNYDVSYSFTKSGSYFTEESKDSDDNLQVYKESGSWNFLGKSKEGERKNKECITLIRQYSTYSNVDLAQTVSIQNYHLPKSLEIIRLTNKELKMRYHFKGDATQSPTNPYYEETMLVWTFEKK
jgi:hypothetical protein